MERLKTESRFHGETTPVEGLGHQDETISSGKPELFRVGTGLTAPERIPFSGFSRSKSSFSSLRVTAGSLLNVNAHRRSGETRNAKDQELLIWKRQDGFQSITLHLQYVTLPIYKAWGLVKFPLFQRIFPKNYGRKIKPT